MSEAPQTIGANGGPAIDPSEFRLGRQLDPALVDLAERSLHVICDALKRDPRLVAAKRKGDDPLSVRQVWFYVLKPFFADDLTGETDNKRCWMLAQIAGLDRGTVADDQKHVEKLIARNGLIAETINSIADMIEPLPGIIANGEDCIADMIAEKAIDRAAAREAAAKAKLTPAFSPRLDPPPAVIRAAESIKDPALRKRVLAAWKPAA